MDQTHLSDTKFSDLNLSPTLLEGLQGTGYEFCTPIQSQTLPLLLKGRDVAGQAQTGTGKTAAFLVATIQRLLEKPANEHRKVNQPRALILAPTRELAVQIHKDAVPFSEHTGLKLGLVYGGANYDGQRQELTDGVDILIGTPGRLIDYFKQGVFDLKALQVMVLDEADRMFDLGFIKDIRYLFRRMPHPEQRLSMLFSATLSFRVIELAYEHMNNPDQVKIESDTVTADRVIQSVYYTANDEKIPLLLTLINQQQPERGIIFVNTKRVAEKVWAFLEGNGFKSGLLSGDIPQKKRMRLLTEFQEGKLPFLVATDVAARGLHIPAVSHVFNFDLPQNAEDYVHRIGRTARAGASGIAISFACEDSAFYLPDIEAYIDARIPPASFDHNELVKPAPPVKVERAPRPGGPRKNSGSRSQGSGSNRSGQNRPPRRSGPPKPKQG